MVSVRMVVLGVVAVVLAGAGIGVAATRDSDTEVATGTTTTVLTTPTTVVEEPTTAVSATSTPPTTAPASPSTTSRRATTTTVARATTTTAPRATTTTTGASGPTCVAEQFDVKVMTDKPSYAPGQTVQITTTLRNKSATACFYNGYALTMSFKDDAGRMYSGVSVIADSFRDVPLQPGQTLTNSGQWDHRACAEPGCAALPSGPYYVTASWSIAGSRYDVLISFILT